VWRLTLGVCIEIDSGCEIMNLVHNDVKMCTRCDFNLHPSISGGEGCWFGSIGQIDEVIEFLLGFDEKLFSEPCLGTFSEDPCILLNLNLLEFIRDNESSNKLYHENVFREYVNLAIAHGKNIKITF